MIISSSWIHVTPRRISHRPSGTSPGCCHGTSIAPALVVEALQHDGVAGGPADEPAHPPVRRVDPGGAPGADPGVIEADGRAGEPGTAAWHRQSGPGHLPDILDRPAT